jgi:UDP-2,3-diacylglucosamine pyrophosphatase LpxH
MTAPARTLALFISDLHLQVSHPRTAEAFFRFLAERAVHADQLYLLGDIFEYWAGDDDLADPFNAPSPMPCAMCPRPAPPSTGWPATAISSSMPGLPRRPA